MLVPLTEVLGLPSFRAAGVQVLTGDPDTVQVRWVHSSEVFEMGALLAGGEVLLTTGLGLHGRTWSTWRVRRAAGRRRAAPLSRSRSDAPSSRCRARSSRRPAAGAWWSWPSRHVVPFERMVEDFHELVVRRRAHAGGGAAWSDFAQVVIDGRGLRALLDEVSRAAGCEVELRGRDDQLIERSSIASVKEDARVSEPVRGPGSEVGTLHLLATSTRQRRRVAGQAAVAVALELGARVRWARARPRPSRWCRTSARRPR